MHAFNDHSPTYHLDNININILPSLLLFFLFLRNKIEVNCSLPLPYTFPYLLLVKWILLGHTRLFPSCALITHVCVQNTTTVLHFESLHECYNFIYPVAIWLVLTQWWLFSTAMAFACLNIPEFMYTNQQGKHRLLPILFLWCCNECICTNVQEPLQGIYLEVEMLAISTFHLTGHSQLCLLRTDHCPHPTREISLSRPHILNCIWHYWTLKCVNTTGVKPHLNVFFINIFPILHRDKQLHACLQDIWILSLNCSLPMSIFSNELSFPFWFVKVLIYSETIFSLLQRYIQRYLEICG